MTDQRRVPGSKTNSGFVRVLLLSNNDSTWLVITMSEMLEIARVHVLQCSLPRPATAWHLLGSDMALTK